MLRIRLWPGVANFFRKLQARGVPQPVLLNHFLKLTAEHIHPGIRYNSPRRECHRLEQGRAPMRCQASSAGRISPALRDHIQHQIPCARLAHLPKSTRWLRVLQFLHAHQPAVNVVL